MWAYVRVCACMWVYVDICKCVCHPVTMCGCVWLRVTVVHDWEVVVPPVNPGPPLNRCRDAESHSWGRACFGPAFPHPTPTYSVIYQHTPTNTNLHEPKSMIFDQRVFDPSQQHYDPRPAPIKRAHRDLSIGAGLASQFLKKERVMKVWNLVLEMINSWNTTWNRVSPKIRWKTFSICVSQISFLWNTFLGVFHQNWPWNCISQIHLLPC